MKRRATKTSSGKLSRFCSANWGLDGLARFLRIYRSGSGDYTRDRHRWLEGATIQEIMAEVERPHKPAA